MRDRLSAGDSDAEALAFIVLRYGNFVLLKPPVQGNTLLLWFGPLAFLMIAGLLFVRFLRRQAAVPATEPGTEISLTPDERRRLDALSR